MLPQAGLGGDYPNRAKKTQRAAPVKILMVQTGEFSGTSQAAEIGGYLRQRFLASIGESRHSAVTDRSGEGGETDHEWHE